MRIPTLIFIFMMIGNAVTAQDKPMPVLRWELIENVDSISVAGPVTGIHNDMLFVGGGANFPQAMPWMGGQKKYHKNIKVFLANNDGVLKNEGEFELPEATAYGAIACTEYGIVYAGGENENGISNKVLLIRWDVTAKKPEIKSLPDLPVAVTNASMVNEGRYIFLAGGETSKSASDIFLCLDMENLHAGWKKMPSVPRPVSHAVFVKLQNDKEVHLYLIGGRKKNENGISDFYSSVYAFDLKSKKWKQKESLPYALSAGTGVTIEDNQILLFGGDKGETFHRAELLIAAMSREPDSVKKEQINKQKILVQSDHPGFSNDLLRYDVQSGKWKNVAQIPFKVPVTTTAVRWKNFIFIPGGEIKAGVRSPYILSGRLSDL